MTSNGSRRATRTSVTQSPDPVPRPEPDDDPGPEPAACARVRAGPHLARRKRDQGRRRARHQLQSERNPGLRRDHAGLPADPRRPRRCPEVSGPSAESEANARPLLPQQQRPGRGGDRSRGAGDVEADRHRDEAQGTGSGAFFHRLGPPLDASVDVFVLGWLGDYVDDFNFLEGLTCESGNNMTGYCDPRYDRLVERARSTPDDADRHRIYGEAEAMLTGPNGALPIIPHTGRRPRRCAGPASRAGNRICSASTTSRRCPWRRVDAG